MISELTLTDLGWSAHFLSQLDADMAADPPVARVTSVARTRLYVLTPDGPSDALPASGEETGTYAVGDWVVLDGPRVSARLERQTEIARHGFETTQLIAANVETMAIVTSCNADFNIARLERYVALAATSGCSPLIVLTKADLADEDPESYVRQAEAIAPMVSAIALNAKAEDDIDKLSPWCGPGQSLALVGSSGVGKTTLANGLTGVVQATQAIREDDAKGRHTTTARHMRRTVAGGWLIDTPGMRSLGMTDAAEGIGAVFADIEELLGGCKFSDCAHATEPGCVIQAAVASGALDADRVARWDKLRREDAHNSATAAEARIRDRAFGRRVQQGKARGAHKRGR